MTADGVDGTRGEVIVVTATEEAAADARVSGRVEDVARAAAALAYRGAQVAAARNASGVRRAALDLGAAGGIALAVVTAFAFANWAAASALTTAVRTWVAALVLTGVWLAVAVLLIAFFLRGERALPRNWRRVLGGEATDTLPERQDAFGDAEQRLRDSLDDLADAVATAAEKKIAAAILPLAGGMVAVGEEMVDATDEVIEAADEITDVIEERMPGGVVVNRAFDFALAPGRVGIRAARTVLNLGQARR